VNWSGCNLTGANLSGANLSGANLSWANLQGANLTDTNLSSAELKNSNIVNAIFTGTDLNGTAMGGVYQLVTGVRSGGITGIPASLPDGPTYLIDGYLAGPEVDLDGADLASADLAGIDFEGATFRGANLANANLTGASVYGDLADANLSGTDLAGAYLTYVSSGGITGTPEALPANWLLTMGYLFGPWAQVRNANLTGVNLAGADLNSIDLTGSNLTDADLAGADLADARVWQTTITGADLSGADLAGLYSRSITGTPAALPQHWTIRKGCLIGPQAFLWGDDLSSQDLSGLDLAGASMEAVNLTGANLSGANFAGADLARAYISKADLTRTVLAGAVLAIFTGGGDTGSPASLPAGVVLRSGYLLGPYMNLTNGNLDGVNLSGLDMAGSWIYSTTFTGANLSGADLAGGELVGARFTKANLDGADLFGTFLEISEWRGATCPDGTSANSHIGVDCAGALAFFSAGFITPRPGSTVATAARRVTVHFKLVTASGASIPASVAAAIGAAKLVRVTLAGPGIKVTRAYCSWERAVREFACVIADPPGIKKGKSHSYTITIAEEPGSSLQSTPEFQTAPHLGKAANPETIHFG